MQKLGFSIVTVSIAVLALGAAGCGYDSFNWGKVGHLVESKPVHLDAEYVTLSNSTLDCGVQEDLWEPAPQLKGLPGERALARITDKARALNFSDDIVFGELRYPFVQIRGDFNLQAIDVQSDRNGPEPNTKLVNIKIGVKIDHQCFPDSLWMLGVRKGNFTEDQVPVLLFRYDQSGWWFDHFMH